ncbi:U-box domain-containing protein 19-like [Musa acuminata AAA Group]|uniref:U-box domain-containing protein 19-like n=1 Tax=Musa acuminata AAA Group TaxID=214697 RepID=UPI0031E0FA9A
MPHPSDSRKFLTLPAVQPGGDVSPAALLCALVALADEILALRSNPFPIHRRSAREAIRQVGAILEFLADVRGRGSALPASAAVGFSELHVALQKLRHLLQDCARPGARLWVLMRSEMVSNEFQMLVRSISTALDVLPLASIDAAPELKELVRLVREQAWRATVGTEPADAMAMRSMWSTLGQFKNGIAPNRIDLRWILDHLRIRSWNYCSEEIAFLEELFLASLDDDDDKEEAALLGSLMAFMVYCRVVLFDAVDDEKSSEKQSKARAKAVSHVNLDHLRCPISLELMTDPVTIATGQTYDRASISKWLKSGCLTCPVTGEKLANNSLVPNSAIRNLMEQFCHETKVPIPEPNGKSKRDLTRTATPLSAAAAGATRMVAAFLVHKLAVGTNQEKNKAAHEIRKLSKSNIFNRACLVEAGSVPWLLYHFSSSDPSIQDNAVAALMSLSKHPSGGKAIVEAGGLGLIVDVIRVALRVEAQQNAAAILFYLSSDEVYRTEIGRMAEAIPTLVELLREGTYRGRKNAIVTLYGLLPCPDNLRKILAAGAIPALTSILSSDRADLVNDAVAVLAKIAEGHDGTTAILESSAVPHLVAFLRSSTSRSGRENCVSALLSLCNNGGAKVVSLLEQIPVLMPSLYSLVTEGSPQAGKKARSLLNHIHHLHDQEDLIMMGVIDAQ